MAGDALVKEGSTQPSMLAARHGHALRAGKYQITVGFVVLRSCLGWAPCALQRWCCVSLAVCQRKVVGWLFIGSIGDSSSGVNVVGWCEV